MALAFFKKNERFIVILISSYFGRNDVRFRRLKKEKFEAKVVR